MAPAPSFVFLSSLMSLHQLLPQALQYLLPTEADWLGEYGLTVECEMREAVAE